MGGCPSSPPRPPGRSRPRSPATATWSRSAPTWNRAPLLAAYRQGLFPMAVDLGAHPARVVVTGAARRAAARRAAGQPLAAAVARRGSRSASTRPSRRSSPAAPTRRAPAAGSTPTSRRRTPELHRLGWAHSVEAWHDGELAGGLYGVAIGGLFAGESMFTRVRDASKVALVGAGRAAAATSTPSDRLLDTQWLTPHLATLGVVEIPRRDYLAGCGRRWPRRCRPRSTGGAVEPGRRTQTTSGSSVSPTSGRPARHPLDQAAGEVDRVEALLAAGRRSPAPSGRRPCRPRAPAPRRAARRSGRGSGPSARARRPRSGRAATRSARARRAR